MAIRWGTTQQGLQLVPVCILTGRNGLAYARQPIAEPDVAGLTAGVAELGKATVLLRDDDFVDDGGD